MEQSKGADLDLAAVAQPKAIYRPAPFWSWNEIMDREELRRQVREMARGGLGGGFVHVRVGLITRYMSEEFLGLIATALEEARAQGVLLYLYDEDRWPSGWAGGAVPLADPAFRTKWLLRLPAGTPFPEQGETTVLAVGPSGERYCRYLSPLGQAWFSGASYADLMDRRAMQTFLQAAYEPYAQRFGADFGGLIPAIFTDEPAITFLPAYADVPRGMLFWTDVLPERFLAQHGYPLLPRLPELFEDVGDYAATRTDYYRTCAGIFEDHFSRQLGSWCRAHGIALTGHYMLEGSLTANLAWDVCTLPHYRHMDWPGIDHLGRQIQEVITGLGCRSVVNQYGKARMMSELYGCAGQHLSFEDRKWIAEQQIILGVNFPVSHLLLYTMAGERKRDFPCNMWYQQPWWPQNGVIDDYLGALCALLAQGQMVPEFLVLHPIESLYPLRRPPSPDQEAWATYHRDDAERLVPLDVEFQALSHALLAQQRQFDYGDETILADVGAIETANGRPLLRVGAMAYPLVLLPGLRSIRTSTLDLLEAFAAAGGPILSIGTLPSLVDGRTTEQDRLQRFVRDHVRRVQLTEAIRLAPMETSGAAGERAVTLSAPAEPGETLEDLRHALDRLLPRLLSVEASEPTRWLWQHTRRTGDTHVILLANLSRRDRVTGALRLGPAIHGPVQRLDLAQHTYLTLCTAEGAVPPLSLHLEPGESLVLVAGRTEPAGFHAGVATPTGAELEPWQELSTWTATRLDDNALTLDLAGFRRGAEPWGAPCPVIALQHVLNDAHYDGPLTLRYTFSSEIGPVETGAVRLVLEHPERCSVRVNDVAVEDGDLPFWRDYRWHQRAIGHLLRRGENRIDLEYPAFQHGDPTSVHDQARRYGTEIEAVYVIGDFAVTARKVPDLPQIVPPPPTPAWTLCAAEGPFTLCAPRLLEQGNLVYQGLPFYAGRVAYRATLTLDDQPEGPIWLEMDRLSVPVVEVLVNGQVAGRLAWRPYRLAVEQWLRRGENTIELILYHSLRNLLGPHHHPAGEEYSVGPHSFRGSEAGWAARLVQGEIGPDWRPSYALTEFGLFGAVRLLRPKAERAVQP